MRQELKQGEGLSRLLQAMRPPQCCETCDVLSILLYNMVMVSLPGSMACTTSPHSPFIPPPTSSCRRSEPRSKPASLPPPLSFRAHASSASGPNRWRTSPGTYGGSGGQYIMRSLITCYVVQQGCWRAICSYNGIGPQ